MGLYTHPDGKVKTTMLFIGPEIILGKDMHVTDQWNPLLWSLRHQGAFVLGINVDIAQPPSQLPSVSKHMYKVHCAKIAFVTETQNLFVAWPPRSLVTSRPSSRRPRSNHFCHLSKYGNREAKHTLDVLINSNLNLNHNFYIISLMI